MIYGVFSDVHGNYEALRIVFRHFYSAGVEGFICCGDLTGYGPQPNECIKLVSSLPSLHCVIGNHDLAALGKIPLDWFNPDAAAAITFTKKKLNAESVKFMRSCALMIEERDFTVVHGSPKNPAEEYLLTAEQFLESADKWHTKVCFVGHTHIPLSISRKNNRFPVVHPLQQAEKVHIAENMVAMINPGSVGQPRDRDFRASCGLYDSEKHTFELCRLEYSIENTQALMRKHKIPALLVERIALGF